MFVKRIGFLLFPLIIGCTFESDEIYFKDIDVSNLSSPEISFFQAVDTLYLRGVTSISFGSNNSDVFFGYDVLIGSDTIKSGETPSSVQINTLNYADGFQDLTLLTYSKSNSSSLADRLSLEVYTSEYTRKVLIDNEPVEFNITGFSIVDSVLNVSWEPYDDYLFQRIEVKERDGREYETLSTIEDQDQISQAIPSYKGGSLDLMITIYAKNERHDFPLSYSYFYDLSVEDQGTDFKLSIAKSPFAGKRTIEVRHYHSFRLDFHGNDPYDTYSVSEVEELELDLRRAFPTKYEFILYGSFDEEVKYLGQKEFDTESNRVHDIAFALNSYMGGDTFIALEGENIIKYNHSDETATEHFVGEGAVISDDALHTLLVDESSISYVANDEVTLLNQYALESFEVEGPPLAWSVSNSGVAYLITDRGSNGDPFRPIRSHSYYLIDMKAGTVIAKGGHSSGPFSGGFPGSTSIVRDDLTSITSRVASSGHYFIIKSETSNRLLYRSTDNNNSFFPSNKDYFIVFEGDVLVKYSYPSIDIHEDGTSTYYESEAIESTTLAHDPDEVLVSRNHYGYTDGIRSFHIYNMETHELIKSVEVVDEIIDNDLYIGLKLFDEFLIARAGTQTNNNTIILEY